MLDPFSVASIVISVSALLLALYRELEGPDISLLNTPDFKLTDRSFFHSGQFVPQMFQLDEISLVFANYGGKGGTILGIKVDFEPNEGFKEFIRELSFYDQDTPITIKHGENYTMKHKYYLCTIDWKKLVLAKVLKEDNQNIEDSIDKAFVEGKNTFQRFISFLSQNKNLGKATCTISLTTGRLRTKVSEKRLFQKLDVSNEYDKTIEMLSERLRSWDLLEPSKPQLFQEFFNAPRSLMFELKSILDVLGRNLDQNNISSSIINMPNWDNFIQGRAFNDEIQGYLINRENMREKLGSFYKDMVDYNAKIRELLYPILDHTQEDYEDLNRKRVLLQREAEDVFDWLRTISKPQAKSKGLDHNK